MKDKLEVGMYVRTKKGIAKIIDRILEPDNYYFKMWVTDKYLEINDDTEYISEIDVLKATHNIIDLIEVGDIIKFDITDIDNYADIQGYNCWEISCEEELNGVKEMIEMESAKLISIVTKEIFSSMEYRLGDDK